MLSSRGSRSRRLPGILWGGALVWAGLGTLGATPVRAEEMSAAHCAPGAHAGHPGHPMMDDAPAVPDAPPATLTVAIGDPAGAPCDRCPTSSCTGGMQCITGTATSITGVLAGSVPFNPVVREAVGAAPARLISTDTPPPVPPPNIPTVR